MLTRSAENAHKKTPYFYGAFFPSGGEGARTPDLIHAMDALSQLSYTPLGSIWPGILMWTGATFKYGKRGCLRGLDT